MHAYLHIKIRIRRSIHTHARARARTCILKKRESRMLTTYDVKQLDPLAKAARIKLLNLPPRAQRDILDHVLWQIVTSEVLQDMAFEKEVKDEVGQVAPNLVEMTEDTPQEESTHEFDQVVRMSVQHLIDDMLSNLVEKMEVSQEKESTDEFCQVVHTSIQHLVDDVLSNLTENSKTEERWGGDCMGEKERLAIRRGEERIEEARKTKILEVSDQQQCKRIQNRQWQPVLSEVFEDMASEEAGRHVVCMPLQYLIDDCVLRHLAEKMEDVSEEEIRGAGKGRSGLRLEARRHEERRDDGILHDQQQFEIPRNFEFFSSATLTQFLQVDCVGILVQHFDVQHVDNLQPKPMTPHFDGVSVDMDKHSAQQGTCRTHDALDQGSGKAALMTTLPLAFFVAESGVWHNRPVRYSIVSCETNHPGMDIVSSLNMLSKPQFLHVVLNATQQVGRKGEAGGVGAGEPRGQKTGNHSAQPQVDADSLMDELQLLGDGADGNKDGSPCARAGSAAAPFLELWRKCKARYSWVLVMLSPISIPAAVEVLPTINVSIYCLE